MPSPFASSRLRRPSQFLVCPARGVLLLCALALSACAADQDTLGPVSPSVVAVREETVFVLRGTVSERHGGPIEGARVAAAALGPNDRDSSSSDITDATGYYVLSGLNRAVTLTIEAPGYEPAQIAMVDVAERPVADVVMVRKVAPPTN